VLEGIRIVEIEGLGPAPFAGMMLADLGAEVIVVHREEPPTPGAPERSLLDRGKKSIVLDLKAETDLSIVTQLIATADGLIEGFRPGVMERLGLGPDDVRETNARLVYGRLTGWGQEGPRAPFAGHDLNYIALSGALWYASGAKHAPFTPPTMVGDIGGGALYLVIGMLSALLQARRSGQGAVVDAAIVDGSAHMTNLLMAAQSVGMIGTTRGKSVLDGSPWSRCYATSDGGWLSVQCLEPKFYEVFREKLGVDADAAFEQNLDPQSWDELGDRIGEIIAGKTLGDWTQIFESSDACVAPVLDPLRAATHPHLAARDTWTEIDGQLQARPAPRFDGQRPPDPGAAPRRGEHTEDILTSLAAAKT
jgi:crotonobetainyl-CoA:carnitine CoA-transferase CaiB-like acyl-CoA transferase